MKDPDHTSIAVKFARKNGYKTAIENDERTWPSFKGLPTFIVVNESMQVIGLPSFIVIQDQKPRFLTSQETESLVGIYGDSDNKELTL